MHGRRPRRPPSAGDRLRVLDRLYGEKLIDENEYRSRREEILKGL